MIRRLFLWPAVFTPGPSSSAPRGTIAMPRSGPILGIFEPQMSQKKKTRVRNSD